MSRDKRLREEWYNRTAKTPGERRVQLLGKLRHLKTVMNSGKLGAKHSEAQRRWINRKDLRGP